MCKQPWPRGVAVVGLAALLLASMVLSGCGGAAPAEPAAVASVPATAVQAPATEEQAAPVTEVATEAPTEAATEVTGTTEAETGQVEATSPATSTAQVAVCQPVEIPTNDAVPEVSADDWALGPDDAPVTVIEYGDFQ